MLTIAINIFCLKIKKHKNKRKARDKKRKEDLEVAFFFFRLFIGSFFNGSVYFPYLVVYREIFLISKNFIIVAYWWEKRLEFIFEYFSKMNVFIFIKVR